MALAVELLGRRWTILVISRLLDGCTTFSEIHKGVPRISPSLLTTRLTELEHAGIVNRRKRKGSNRYAYELTEAGRDLDDIVTQLAIWGQHWARDNDMDDLDLGFLAWSMHLRINADLRQFVETWRGFRDLRKEIRASRIRLTGPRELKKAFPDWLMMSIFANVERRSPGREKRLSSR